MKGADGLPQRMQRQPPRGNPVLVAGDLFAPAADRATV
jgi:hypothetical protein